MRGRYQGVWVIGSQFRPHGDATAFAAASVALRATPPGHVAPLMSACAGIKVRHNEARGLQLVLVFCSLKVGSTHSLHNDYKMSMVQRISYIICPEQPEAYTFTLII